MELNNQSNQVHRLQTQNEVLNKQLGSLQLEAQTKEAHWKQLEADNQQERERLQASKKTEKEKQDKNIREWCDQVKQLESILTNKDEQVKELSRQKQEVEQQIEHILTTQSESKQAKMTAAERQLQEQLDQQNLVRARLNEHIAYLQSEIRKRDDLLDDSDEDDDDVSDSITDDGEMGEDEDEDSDQIRAQMQRAAQRAEGRNSVRKTTQQIFKD